MRIAVLCSPESWYFRDLQRAAEGRVRLHSVPFSRIQATLGALPSVTSVGERLDEFDAVIVRTMPPGSLEQVVFRMDALHRLQAQGMRVINSPRAIETAVDKYLTLAKLQAAGFDVPRTETSQTADDAMEGFSRLGGDVVVKPLFGSEGRGIARIHDEAIAVRTFKMLAQLGAVIYQQEYISHEGFDDRLLVIGKDVMGIRRRNPLDWRTNISRGAKAEPLTVTSAMREMALKAAQSVAAEMAGVDILQASDGRRLLIEVNAVPGWRAVQKTLGVDVAERVLKLLDPDLATASVGHVG